MLISRANRAVYAQTQKFLRAESTAEESMAEIVRVLRAANLPIERRDRDVEDWGK